MRFWRWHIFPSSGKVWWAKWMGKWSNSLLPVLNLLLLLFLFSSYFSLSCFILFLLLQAVLHYRVRIGHCICYRRETPKRDSNSRVLWRHDKYYLTSTSVESDSVRDNWTGCFRFLNWMKKLYDLKLLLLCVGVSKTRNKAEYFVSSRSPERMGCMWLVPTRTQSKPIKHCM